ncbi:shikimate dehydrogenase family protein [Pseudooceanicola aestuarii]|uniref:shikimate dehydrogenase family protein n=1 Tax=Pseudooceanicola aestuarii TaxID=2697319 RepID=UPI0013CFCA27|nr:shikimate dehydrogenase [Pseudooceanicola aestuarii]
MQDPDAPRLHITGRTAVLFIMGDPIDHVIGTDVLNRTWVETGRALVTVPLQVRAADLPYMLDMLRRAPNVAGTGITIPHKIAAVALVDHLTDAALQAGAVNFIRRNADGTLTGHNVDGAGFVAGLAAQGVAATGRDVLMLGAGGVGRAIAFAMAGGGARSLTIRNRDVARARALADAIRDSGVAPGCALHVGDGPTPGLIINATALGMDPDDPLPLPADQIPLGAIVAEVVMTPAITPLLTAAQARNCRIVPGRAMMDPQAGLVGAFLDGTPA